VLFRSQGLAHHHGYDIQDWELMYNSLMKICGIYKIANKTNGKSYIGSSRNIDKRLMEHRRLLRLGTHANQHLQSSWNYHGEVSFSFEIIYLCSGQDLQDAEVFFIDRQNTHYKNGGYNMTAGGDGCGCSGAKHPTYGVSPWNKGKKESPSVVMKMRLAKTIYPPVLKLDENSFVIGRYFNCTEAANLNGLSRSIIHLCLQGKRKTAGKYRWKYEK
jgi:hypothetical protein